MYRSRAERRHLKALASIPALRACPQSELAAVARYTTPISLPAGAVLCREGTKGLEAFVIVEGEAEVTVDGRTIARLGPGAFCGEMALVERGVRTATVTAITPMEALAMSVSEFESLLADAPCLLRSMVLTLSARLRDADGGLTAPHVGEHAR